MNLPYTYGNPVRLVSPYGYRTDPITGQTGVWHSGVDLVSDGDKTIRAVAGGTVLQSRMVTDASNRTSEWGNYVSIRGDDGRLYYYCHMSRRIAEQGQRVKAGAALGIEGSTGRSTGSHLHFEIREGDNATTVNPCDVIGIPNQEGTYIEEKEREEAAVSKETKASNTSWSDEAVEWATENGILYGDGKGDLMLDEPCTRRMIVVFLYRAVMWILKKLGGTA